mmetsp:Transcript_146/g.527  ORF Transcript_146/g.527 Transcript_146/m.527 type:complete len:532 (-) Transcript_146:438-2033(-)
MAESQAIEPYDDAVDDGVAKAFAQLQAILAGLPMHAVPESLGLLSCAAAMPLTCAAARPKPPSDVTLRSGVERIQDVLTALSEEYSEHQEVLRRLEVVHASLDLVCFADHEESCLFTAVRGTDRNLNPLTFPRDWSNNLLIAVGSEPYGRTAVALDYYRQTRSKFPNYTSYGSGHSLGGAVMVQLAKHMEEDLEYRFARIDVFNTATSPFSRGFLWLHETALHVHRVPGDWASMGLSSLTDPNLHVHPVKPHVPERHSLVHFLPTKASEKVALDEAERLQERRRGSEANMIYQALSMLAACAGPRQKDRLAILRADSHPLASSLSPLSALPLEKTIPSCIEDDDDSDVGSAASSTQWSQQEPPPAPAPDPLTLFDAPDHVQVVAFHSSRGSSSSRGGRGGGCGGGGVSGGGVSGASTEVGGGDRSIGGGGESTDSSEVVEAVAFPPPSPRGEALPDCRSRPPVFFGRDCSGIAGRSSGIGEGCSGSIGIEARFCPAFESALVPALSTATSPTAAADIRCATTAVKPPPAVA